MNRRSFRTKNTLELHSLVYITVMCFVLLALFLALANVGKIVRIAGLDSGNADEAIIEKAVDNGPDELIAERIETSVWGEPYLESRFSGGNGSLKVALWGESSILDSLSSQLMIMEQSYDRIGSLNETKGYDLIVTGNTYVSEEEAEYLTEYIKNGGNVWFTNLSRQLADSEKLKDFLGIENCGKVRSWPGIRFSGDMATGSIMENPKYKVAAVEVTLENKVKMYACALPRGYKKMEIEELPPLIWRHVAGGGYGSVYVCNGNFMDTEAIYFMLPTILSELQGNYVYGIINAYCSFVEGFPYAFNEERDSWKRFYSRDKFAIAQDMLSAQYLRYYTGYGAHITYFSKDRDVFLTTEDKSLQYYTDNIDSSMGLLAYKDGDGLFLTNSSEKLKISPWKVGSAFTEDGKYCLPVDFEYTVDNEEEVTFSLLGSAVGLGYYTFTNDVDELLDYDERDVWDEYCKNQEVVFGIGVQQCEWLERVTASQALERLYEHLNAKTDIKYEGDTVDITTDADDYWLIFKGRSSEIEITGGTAEEIGKGCWLIGVSGGHAVITCK